MIPGSKSDHPSFRKSFLFAMQGFRTAVTTERNIKVMLVSPASEWSNNNEERKFLTKYGAPTIPFFNDTENKLSLSLGIGSTPYTVIMNKQGKKVATIQGEADWSSNKLYKQIKQLIKPNTIPEPIMAPAEYSNHPNAQVD